MSLFSIEGLQFLMRWGHFLAGITWIGLLYYFNFVQVPFFAETDPAVRSGAIQKLVPRALWWFRWGALFTFLTGLTILLIRGGQGGGTVWSTSWGVAILTGGALGTLMFLNVWLVIWPKQKIVIASAIAAAGGGTADPRAGPAGRRAFLASRTNTLLSIPMLFFMGAASHWPLFTEQPRSLGGYWLAALVISALIELNTLVGSAGPTKKPLDTHPRVIVSGFILAAIFYLVAKGLL